MSDPRPNDATGPDTGPDSGPEPPATHSIQIADEPGGAPPDDSSGGSGGYDNMWVPLIVVPGAIVIVVVIIFAMFGALAGDERSIEDNLRVAVQGGKNERQQARFNLIRQLVENIDAQADERDAPYGVPENFADQLEVASRELDDDPEGRLVVALALSWFDPGRGAAELVSLLDTPADEDPDNRVRINALLSLGNLSLMDVAEAQPAEAKAIELMGDDDVGLRVASAAALQAFGGSPEARAILIGGLDDVDLQVRANSAYSLARLDPPDPAAIPLLTDMVGDELWLADREAYPARWRDAELRMRMRVQAVQNLAAYGEATRETLATLDQDGQELRIRDAVRRSLAELDGE